jgi:hypothetical protein
VISDRIDPVDFTIVSRDVIVVPNATEDPSPTGALGAMRSILGAAVEVMGAAAFAAGSAAAQAIESVAGPPTAAVLDRVVPTATQAVIERINITTVVVNNVDLRAIVMQALQRLDLTEIVLERVDLKRVVEAALDSIDLTEVVLQRVDLERIVDAALDELDLTALIAERVDIDALVATVDLDPIIDRLPIVDIAEYVIEMVDLPAIIRQSTGGVASDAIDSVRLRSYATDIALARIVDRVLPRRARDLEAPGEPESLSGGDGQ